MRKKKNKLRFMWGTQWFDCDGVYSVEGRGGRWVLLYSDKFVGGSVLYPVGNVYKSEIRYISQMTTVACRVNKALNEEITLMRMA